MLRARGLALVMLLALGAWEPFRAPNADVEAGNRAFAAGNYDDALAAYERAARDGSIDPDGLAFDRGTAELEKARATQDPAERGRMLDRAVEDLKLAERAADPRIKSDAEYNRGNALMAQDKLEDAIEAYKQALHARPDFEDARVNLEMALRKRQKQRKQQQQQQQGQQGQQGQQQGQQGQQQGQQGQQQGQQGQQQGQQGQQQGQQGQQQGQQGQQGQQQGQQGQQGQPQDQQGAGSGSGGSGSGAGSGSAAGSGSGSGSGMAGSGSAGSDSPDSGSGSGSDGGQNGPDAQGAPGHDRHGRPHHGHSQGHGPEGPTDRKLDDLEDLSRALRRQNARDHATGRTSDPDRDW